jgi:polar amino acid transport system substrate-binding protein
MIVSGLTITPRRNTRVAFVGPYAISGKSILTKSANLATVESIEELNNERFRITALKSSTSQKFVEKVIPKAKLTTTADYDEGVKAVMEGNVDAMVADFPICALTMLRYPDAGLATLSQPLTIAPIGIALPPGDSLLGNMVTNYLGALEGTGLLELLEKKWFEDGSWLLQVP